MPASFRWVTLAATLMGFQIALLSLTDFEEARHPEQPVSLQVSPCFGSAATPDDPTQKLRLAQLAGRRGALLAMQPWRSVTLVLLAGACGLVFFLAMRLRLRARNAPRTALWLSRATMVAAVFRMIDGAESMVIMRASVDASKDLLLADQSLAGTGIDPVQISSVVSSVIVGGWSLLMVTAFVAMSGYYRSERLRETLARFEPAD